MTCSTHAFKERLKVGKRELNESQDSAKIAMRLLIRSANLDRRLLSDKDWQEAMVHVNALIRINT